MFFSVLTVAAFTGCSKDDSDDGGLTLPSITVNGVSSATVSVGYSGGATPAVEVVSSGDWTLTITSGDGTVCQASPASGKAGTTSVSFNVNGAVTKDRMFVATLTTTGKIAGFERPVSATVTIIQTNALYLENCGSNVEKGDGWPKVTEYSGWIKGGLNDQSGVTYGGSSASVANSGNAFKPTEAELAVASGAPYASMNTASSKFYINDINIGSSKSFTFTFTAIQQVAYSESSEFGPVEASTIRLGVSVNGGREFLPATYTVDQIADGGNWYLCTSEFKLPATASTDKISIRFDNFNCPTSQYGLRLDDLKLIEGGNGTELTPAETTSVSISEIVTSGEFYEVEGATVVGTYQQGFVMQDETGAILVYMGYNAKDIPAEGSIVTVSGEATKYGDALQLKDVNVVSVTAGTMPTLTPTVVTADNITGMMTSPKATYVKMTGTVDVSTKDDKTYYNVKFLFNSSYTGSISYPNENLNVSSFDGKTVDVEGWFVNNGSQNGSGKYFTVVARSITENSNPASASFTTQPKTFAATDPVAQKLTFTMNNVETVEFEITGDNKDMFTHEYTSGTTVTVKAVGNNTSDAAYTATLNLKGDGVVLASVPLKQAAPSTGAEGAPYLWNLASQELGNGSDVPAGTATGKGEPAMDWKYSASPYIGFNGGTNGKGTQIGKDGAPAEEYSLTTSDYTDAVSKIVVNASIAKSGDGKLTVKVGGTQIGETVSLTTTATDYEFVATSPVSGEISIELTNTEKAMYLKSIAINPAE